MTELPTTWAELEESGLTWEQLEESGLTWSELAGETTHNDDQEADDARND
jgi:hypothetical protein